MNASNMPKIFLELVKLSWSALMQPNHSLPVCRDTAAGDLWGETENGGHWQTDRKEREAGLTRWCCSWVMKPPPEIPQPIAEKPGRHWCCRKRQRLFFFSPPPSSLSLPPSLPPSENSASFIFTWKSTCRCRRDCRGGEEEVWSRRGWRRCWRFCQDSGFKRQDWGLRI